MIKLEDLVYEAEQKAVVYHPKFCSVTYCDFSPLNPEALTKSVVFPCKKHIICQSCLGQLEDHRNRCPYCKIEGQNEYTVFSPDYAMSCLERESILEDPRPRETSILLRYINNNKFQIAHFDVSFFTPNKNRPLQIRLNEYLLPFVNLPRRRFDMADDLRYHELLVAVADAKNVPSRQQTPYLAKSLLNTKTNLLCVRINQTEVEAVLKQYDNAEAHGFCAILSAEFMGEYVSTGVWPDKKKFDTSDTRFREKLIENITSVLQSVHPSSSDDSKGFIDKLTSMRDTLRAQKSSSRSKSKIGPQSWLNSEYLLLYFSLRFPGQKTAIFHYDDQANDFVLKKSLYDEEAAVIKHEPLINNSIRNNISFKGFQDFVQVNAAIIFDTGSMRNGRSGHYYPAQLSKINALQVANKVPYTMAAGLLQNTDGEFERPFKIGRIDLSNISKIVNDRTVTHGSLSG